MIPRLPLSNLRVLDLSAPESAYCGHLLAGYGADVIRAVPPWVATPGSRSEELLDAWYDAGTTRVLLDYSSSDALESLGRLAASAAVVLAAPSASRPVVGYTTEPLGLTWVPPSVLTCFLTAFGATGPLRDWRATPKISHAMSGLMHQVGPVEGPPRAIPGRQHWDEAGIRAAICIVGALRNGLQEGAGVLDISCHEVAAAQDDIIQRFDVAGFVMGRDVNFGVPPTGTWETADGYVNIAANTPGHWDAFVQAMGSPELLVDEMWRDREMRLQLHDVLTPQIESMLKDLPSSTFVEAAQSEGLPCAVTNTPAQFVGDQRDDERGPLAELTLPDSVTIDVPGPPVRAEPPIFTSGYRLDDDEISSARVASDGWSGDDASTRSFGAVAQRAARPPRVVTFGSFVAGNTAAMILAEIGMDVVKIESRERPEVLRNRYFTDHPDVWEPSGVPTTALYGGLARSVRSVSLEIAQPEGAKALHRLVENADIVIENFRPHVLSGFGCGFDDLQRVNPKLSMLSISGYGRTGARSAYASYASNIGAYVGLNHAWGYVHGYHFDYVAAYHGAMAVLAAMELTSETGRGVHLDVSQVEAAGTVMTPLTIQALGGVPEDGDSMDAANRSVFSEVLSCDGPDRWLAVDVVDDADVGRLAALLEVPTDGTEGSYGGLRAELAAWAQRRTPMQAAHQLQHAGIAAAPVQNGQELWSDPQLRERGFVVEIVHDDLGSVSYPGAIERDVAGGGVKGPVPRLGEHTTEVFTEWAGLDETALAALGDSGAIWSP